MCYFISVQRIDYHDVTFNLDYDEVMVESDTSSTSDEDAGLFSSSIFWTSSQIFLRVIR